MTVVRSDSGLVVDPSSLGPAKVHFVPAGSPAGAAFTGLGVLLGFSAENSGSADNSLANEGTATGPAAGATIASVVVPAGTYVVSWTVGYGAGAVAAAELNNMQLTGGPANVVALIPAVANQQQPQSQVTITTAGATIAVKAIGAATATAVYEAQLVVTPVAAGFVRLYDGQNAPTVQVATSFLAELQTETEWFGDQGLELKRGLWVVPGVSSIAVTVYFIVLQDQ